MRLQRRHGTWYVELRPGIWQPFDNFRTARKYIKEQGKSMIRA